MIAITDFCVVLDLILFPFMHASRTASFLGVEHNLECDKSSCSPTEEL